MLAYLLAEGKHRTSRTLGSVAGVALGVALFTSLVAAGNGFVAAARQPLADVGADVVISRPDTAGDPTAQTTRGVRQPFGLAPLASSEVQRLAGLDGVDEATGGLLLWDFSASSYQTVLGVDVEPGPTESGAVASEDAGSRVGPARLAQAVAQGRFFESGETGVVVVDQHYAAFFSLKPGVSVEIAGASFDVVGIVSVAGGNQTGGANFYLPLADAQLLAGLDAGQVNQVYLRVGQAIDVESVVADAEAELGDLGATTEQSIVSVMGGITAVSDRFALVAAGAALLGGLLLTAVTLHAGIKLRAHEVGIMKAVGWRSRDVVRVFTLEGAALSTLGALVGIALGWLTVLGLAQISVDLLPASATTPALSEVAPAESFKIAARLSWGSVLVAVSSALVAGGLTSRVSSRRASRLHPADALRD